MEFKTVSQHLLKPMDKLVFKLTVSLRTSKGQDAFYNIFEMAQGNYLTFNLDTYISFQFRQQGLTYDVNQTVRITDETLFQVNKSFQEFYAKLNRKDLFTYYQNGAIVCNPRRDDRIVISLKTGGFIELEPGVIADTNSNTVLPGVYMYLNIKENKIELSIDEFEAIMYKMSKIDLTSAGLQLFTASDIINKRIEKYKPIGNNNIVSRPPEVNIFQKFEEENSNKEEVVDMRPKIELPKSLNDMLI